MINQAKTSHDVQLAVFSSLNISQQGVRIFNYLDMCLTTLNVFAMDHLERRMYCNLQIPLLKIWVGDLMELCLLHF